MRHPIWPMRSCALRHAHAITHLHSAQNVACTARFCRVASKFPCCWGAVKSPSRRDMACARCEARARFSATYCTASQINGPLEYWFIIASLAPPMTAGVDRRGAARPYRVGFRKPPGWCNGPQLTTSWSQRSCSSSTRALLLYANASCSHPFPLSLCIDASAP